MLDQYGNFVIQTALRQCKGALHTAFVEAIRPHAAVLQSSMYGKRVLSRTYLKNKQYRFGSY
uniref:PUM-HD domain-containing protein n=1 Tax=Arundo donax TaxID=35708 RepID=A0A0A8XZI4_ARUDO